MLAYLRTRLLLALCALGIVSVMVFAVVRLIPGDTVDILLSGRGTIASPESKEALRRDLGLDAAFSAQYMKWLVGSSRPQGRVLRLRDRGTGWEGDLSNGHRALSQVQFVTPDIGFGLSSNGAVYRTETAGSLWEQRFSHAGQRALALHFLDEAHGWVVGDRGLVLVTQDGGRCWTRYGGDERVSVPVPVLVPQSGDVSCADPNAGRNGERLDARREVFGDRTLRDVFFGDVNHGWILGDDNYVVRTDDGGRTWHRSARPLPMPARRVAFAGPRRGWVVGDHGMILRSEDGGDTWVTQYPPTTEDLRAIVLERAEIAWIAGKNGTVLKTVDNGITWQRQATGVTEDLQAVTLTGPGAVGAVGDNGVVVLSRDGGETWVAARRDRNIHFTDIAALTARSMYVVGAESVWEAGVLGGNLGNSITIRPGKPVVPELLRAFPISVLLSVLAMAMAVLVAVPAGILSAVRRGSVADYVSRLGATMGLCVPSFWLATMVVLLPAYWMGWTLPLADSRYLGESIPATLEYLAIPAAVASLPRMASVMRMTRSALLEVLGLDYVRTAWAKGLRGQRVILRHALGNALIPVVSVLGLQMAAIVGEIVIIENIFNVPGMGRLIVESIFQRDYPMLQGAALLTAIFITVLNLAIDVSYLYLDPRVRYV